MKIVGIISSARNNGTTAALVREALKSAKEAGASVTEIFLHDYNIKFCTGCSECMRTGVCYHNDSFQEIKNILINSDGIILSSPTYAGSSSAMIKRLFERIGMLEFFTSEIFGGKYCVGISASNGFGSKKVPHQLVEMVTSSVMHRGYVTGTLLSKPLENSKESIKLANLLGKKLVDDIRSHKKYPFQNILGRFIGSIIIKPILKKVVINNKDRLNAAHTILTSKGQI